MSQILSDISLHFLLSLSLGTALFSWIADPKLTGAGFIRLIAGHGIIFLTLAIGITWGLDGVPEIPWIILQSILLANLVTQWKIHPDGKTPFMWILFVLQVALTLIYFYGKIAFLDSTRFPDYAFIISSVLFLGITHYAMLLGHYYLVVPKLTEKPLIVCLKIFWLLLVVKLFFSGHATYQASEYLTEGTILGDGYTFNWLIVSMRWLWGYGALATLSWFAWKLCKMRSIQSATGVLYIMVFFVFVGELLSAYLFFKHGLKI